jgi:hypothetical protein
VKSRAGSGLTVKEGRNIMKSIEELRDFYQTALLSQLNEFEKPRKILATTIISACIISVCTFVSLIWYKMESPRRVLSDDTIELIISCVIGISLSIVVIVKMNYTSKYKGKIVKSIVEFLDSRLTYSENSSVNIYRLSESKIFLINPNVVESKDNICGRLGETYFTFSEVKARFETDKEERKGVNIFKGLFIIAGFNKTFSGETIVLPDIAQRALGSFGQLLQSANKVRGQLIKLEDPEFEKLFVVYGSDQIEARYILTPGLMRRIVDFTTKAGRKVHLSFVNSKVYIAIPYWKNLFEPKLFKSLASFEDIQRYYEDVNFIIGIIDELNLNTRIWSNS